jgi:hypothetical protein
MNGKRTVVAPCSACYLNLAKADNYMQERPSLGVKVNEALCHKQCQSNPICHRSVVKNHNALKMKISGTNDFLHLGHNLIKD